MEVHRMKLLAAAVLVATGLAMIGGSGWLTQADAQGPPPKKEVAPTQQQNQEEAKQLDGKAKVNAPKWEFHYVPQTAGYAPKKADFEEKVQAIENGGWEFVGTVAMTWDGPLSVESKRSASAIVPTMVFKRRRTEAVPIGKIRSEYYDAAAIASSVKAMEEYLRLDLALLEHLTGQKNASKNEELPLLEASIVKVRGELAKLQVAAGLSEPGKVTWSKGYPKTIAVPPGQANGGVELLGELLVNAPWKIKSVSFDSIPKAGGAPTDPVALKFRDGRWGFTDAIETDKILPARVPMARGDWTIRITALFEVIDFDGKAIVAPSQTSWENITVK